MPMRLPITTEPMTPDDWDAVRGFRVVGVRERFGRQGDRWRDVLLLERRSARRGRRRTERRLRSYP